LSRFLVTGGAGFIGGHITELIVKEGHEAIVFDDFSTGRMENLSAVEGCIEIIRGDIRDIDTLRTATEGVDYVVHHAAEISVIKSLENPEFVNEVNITGTLNVLIAAKENGVKRVVLASSSAVYGDTGSIAQDEAMLPQPLSPYGVSKLAGEHYCRVFYHLYGLETVCLRYFNVFGPRQNPSSQYAAVIPKFIDRILKGQELHIYGDGEQTRDFVYVENVARANLLACMAPSAAGKIFNIAGGKSISVNELAERLKALAVCYCSDGLEIQADAIRVVHDPPVAGEIKYSISNINLARSMLGFEPVVSFEEGLKRTFDYFAAKTRSI